MVYLHDPERSGDARQAVDSGVGALARMRDEGLVRAIGIGSSDLGAIEHAVRTDAVDLVMLPGRYTLLEARRRTSSCRCRGEGVGIVNVAVFNSGLAGHPGAQ